MESPPTPSSPTPPLPPSGHEPDVPRPPIWQRSAPAAPPIQIPAAGEPAQAPAPRPIVPEGPAVATPPPPARVAAPAVQPTPQTGPTFDSSYGTGLGVGTPDRPNWPAVPPTGGQPLGAPAAPPPAASKRKFTLLALALLLAAAVAIGAFLFGRSFGSTDSVSTPIAAPSETATQAPEPTAPPTAAPAPTAPAPSPVPARPAPAPQLPDDLADEPVAAVASAVAPAVVLITNDLGQGSGIIYDEAGLILTNAHVVGQFTEVDVTLASGVIVPGDVLGADPLTDVAVVRIETDSEYGVAALAPESSVQVGQLAVAIGSPFGLEQTVTSGVVSAVGRVLQNPTDDGRVSVVAMLQTDAPINPGNSGGALADRQGRVIGMNTSIRTDGSGGNIGVGFAIPADTAKLIADRIIAGDSLEQGFLGINGGTPIIGEPGVVVGEVTAGSGAAAAGLQPGDLITGFNGEPIKSMSDLAAAVRLQPPEATVTVEFNRDGQQLSVDVTLGVLTQQ